MVKHVVMFDFKDAEGKTALENAKITKEMGEALMGKVPSLRSMEIEINELKSETSQDLVIIATFDDFDGLKAYDVHPEHQKVVTHIKATAGNRHAVDFTF